jgi:hypothetical protein
MFVHLRFLRFFCNQTLEVLRLHGPPSGAYAFSFACANDETSTFVAIMVRKFVKCPTNRIGFAAAVFGRSQIHTSSNSADSLLRRVAFFLHIFAVLTKLFAFFFCLQALRLCFEAWRSFLAYPDNSHGSFLTLLFYLV